MKYCSLVDIYDEAEELLLLHDSEEPSTYYVASMSREWVNAMKSELKSIRKKNWIVVKLPSGRKPIGLKIGIQIKKGSNWKSIKS